MPTLKDRFTAALKAATRAMRFGGLPALTYGHGGGYGGYAWGRNANYAQLVGDPLDNSIVAATVGWIGRTFPEAPLRVVREAKGGNEPVPSHPLSLKMRRPNPFDSASLLWTPIMLSYILDGNAYLLKERTNGGDLLNLWYVPHWTMEPKWSSPTEHVSYYEYKVDGVTTRYDPADVIHLRNGKDPRNTRKGLSQVKAVIREIYSDNMATQYSAAMLSNYGTPGMILSPASADQSFTPENAGVIKQDVIEKTTGDRRGEPIIFLDPVKVDLPAFSPQQMNIRETQYTPEERVSAVLGIPAIVVGLGAGLQHGTFANTKQMKEKAYDDYLIPTKTSIAEQLTIQLLPDFSDAADEMVDWDYSQVRALQDDADAVAKRAVTLFQGSLIDRAHGKTIIGVEPDAEDEGIYYLPRGGSFSDGAIAEPVQPQTVPADTEPSAAGVPGATPHANGHRAEPLPAHA